MMRMTAKNCANCDRKFEIPDYFDRYIFHCASCLEEKYKESYRKALYGTGVFLVCVLGLTLLYISLFLWVFEDGSTNSFSESYNPRDKAISRFINYGYLFSLYFLSPWVKFSMYRKEKKRYEEIRETMEYIESGE